MLAPWCVKHQYPLPGVSTIGRMIAATPDKMCITVAVRLGARGQRKPLGGVRKRRKPRGIRQPPLAVFACDTVVRIRDGRRRYLFTFIDPHSRFAIAFAAATRSGGRAAVAFDALCGLLPSAPQYLLSDSGGGFMGEFHKSLGQRDVTYWWTYLKFPQRSKWGHCLARI